MLRDITLGQYYPVDSAVHRLDPRTKLFGTMVYIISLFIADNIWGYLLATLALAGVIHLTKVPFGFMVRGLKAVVILLLISVSFNLFLTDGETLVRFWIFRITREGAELGSVYGPAPDLSGNRFLGNDLDHHAQPTDRRPGEKPGISEQGESTGSRGFHDDVDCFALYSDSGGRNR